MAMDGTSRKLPLPVVLQIDLPIPYPGSVGIVPRALGRSSGWILALIRISRLPLPVCRLVLLSQKHVKNRFAGKVIR